MPIYEYRALNDRGDGSTGFIDADSPKEARDKLRRQKLFVTDISPVKEKERRRKKGFLPAFLAGRALDEVSTVTRQLATLLGAGIPLAQSLQAIIEQTQGGRLETVFRDIKEQVVQGVGFAEALQQHPFYFNNLFVSMVKAGEASGTLDDVLTRLSEYIQSQTRLRARISAAMAYPAMMLLIGTGVVIFLMVKVVPDITKLLIDQGKDLPWMTRMLVDISRFLQSWWWMIPIIALASWSAWRAWVATPAGKRAWDRFLISLPVFGDLFKKIAVSRFAVTFATLLKSGLPALESLRFVRDVVNNQVLADTLDQVHANILEGTDISTPIKRSGVFPPVVGYMMAIGEQSGRLEELLDRIAAAYDEEVEIATQKFTAMLEPILIVVMAGMVGFIVAAIMIPLLPISKTAGA